MAGTKTEAGTKARAGVTAGARAPRQPKALKMAGLEQVRALSHPLRLRLLEFFAQRPRTTKQAADALGEAPTKLYHHVAALEKAGLVRLCETRPNRGATEKYFEAVARRIEGGAEAVGLGRKSARRDHSAIGLVLFDQARQELIQALAREPETPPKPLMAVRGVFRAAPSAIRKLQKELQQLLTRIAESGALSAVEGRKSRAKLRRYSLTLALLPLDGEE